MYLSTSSLAVILRRVVHGCTERSDCLKYRVTLTSVTVPVSVMSTPGSTRIKYFDGFRIPCPPQSSLPVEYNFIHPYQFLNFSAQSQNRLDFLQPIQYKYTQTHTQIKIGIILLCLFFARRINMRLKTRNLIIYFTFFCFYFLICMFFIIPRHMRINTRKLMILNKYFAFSNLQAL